MPDNAARSAIGRLRTIVRGGIIFLLTFLSPELASTALSEFIAHPYIYGVVAELDGQIVGGASDERSIVASIGPITVDPFCSEKSRNRRRG